MATTAPIHKNRNTTMGRINTFITTGGIFREQSLASQIYSDFEPYQHLYHWELPGGNGAWKDYTFADIIAKPFDEIQTGSTYGPTWHTHWFKVEFTVPDRMVGKEVHFLWNSETEASLYNPQGDLLNAFSDGFRNEYIISKSWDAATGPLTYYVEMTCNQLFGAGGGDSIAPTDNNRYYTLRTVELRIFNRNIYKLVTDIDMLRGISNELSNDHRGYQAMFCANEMINLIRKDNDLEKASQLADAFFAEGGGSKNHTIVSMGNCHIDTAWLWPYDETKRKCARSWVAQIRLMAEYPDFKFVCSQAQQFAWVKQYYPKLFDEIKIQVAAGRFVPAGGTWVEMDGNLPSGESFIRQFYYGQGLFEREFGILCKEYWLPDTFGYSAQIPQIVKHVGMTRFLTQKMSWNMVNKFPNHSFWWEGLDGSQIISHFPPGNSYNMDGSVNQLTFTVNNSEDKGRASSSIYLFGVGDGGGGPTRQMLERQNRLKDVDGLPKIVFGDPTSFFEGLEQEGVKLSKWVGELYFEKHNGTYTSQARIKWYNRKCEFFFREVEHLISMAYTRGLITKVELDAEQVILDKKWENFLLNQFHDILPGSCIQLAREDAWALYAGIFTELTSLRKKYSQLFLGSGTTERAIFNPLHWNVQTVVFNKPDTGTTPANPNIQKVELDADPTDYADAGEGQFKVPNSFDAALVNLGPGGFTLLQPIAPTTNQVTFTSNATRAELGNGIIRVEVDISAPIPKEEIYFTGPSGQEHKVFGDRLSTGILGGQFYIYDDIPMEYDAWDVLDYHLETQRVPDFIEINGFTEIAQGPVVGGYKLSAKFGDRGSSLTRYTILRANSPMLEYYTVVDWKESHKLLKVEFPLDVLAREATYEVQFGHLKRPTHINTSWDMAKFEVMGHKWMNLSQGDKGVTVITDSKYGWHARDNIVKLSLLRSPKNPDGECDMHKHFIYYAVLPHEGTFQKADTIRRAYELNYLSANNVPFWSTSLADAALPRNLLTINGDDNAVVVSAIKTAPKLTNTIVARLYESHGGKASASITLAGFTIKSVIESNGLETAFGSALPVSANSFNVDFKPFQVRTFLIEF